MAVSSIEPQVPETDSAAGLVKRLGLQFGAGAGLACVLWMVALQVTGSNGFGPKQILAQLLVPLAAVASEWLLRRQLAPLKPGLGRSLGVGMLTVLLAAVISAGGVLGLAYGAGEPALARNRAEVAEIVRAQVRENPKVKRSEQEIQQQLQNVSHLTVMDLVKSNFTVVVLFGLVLGLPGGIFFRE
ncbi:DUF4199 domain-containing protein [Hymenobacter terricola]|uniref:DUF4199 domain-containing protein n=1 Tax=Hymenobacter terricola TaxID=2819236 RepID=UPI001B30C0CC|nr:DUF4199 domain-containing protein [Hymenobacter terricola]